jgi:hypothetical protein
MDLSRATDDQLAVKVSFHLCGKACQRDAELALSEIMRRLEYAKTGLAHQRSMKIEWRERAEAAEAKLRSAYVYRESQEGLPPGTLTDALNDSAPAGVAAPSPVEGAADADRA